MNYLIKGSPQKPAFKILALKEAKKKKRTIGFCRNKHITGSVQ